VFQTKQKPDSQPNSKPQKNDLELLNMNEDEKRRLENQVHGDTIDDKLEEFFSKYQDTNPQNGNNQISGLVNQDSESLESMIEKQNVAFLQQSVQMPVYLRNTMSILNSVGSGGEQIANALLGVS